MKKKVALILSGCGVFDGSEIHEATMTMYALSKNDIEYECFAPDINQTHVINHLTGKEMQESRNVLVESARLARGVIKDIKDLHSRNFDAVVLPGGLGAAKNLSNFAFKGDAMTVNPETERVIKEFHSNAKPIVALCIAPTIVAKVLNAKVTIGNDKETANAIINMGGEHENQTATGVCIDKSNKIITNPCYMLASNIYEIGEGAEACVKALKTIM